MSLSSPGPYMEFSATPQSPAERASIIRVGSYLGVLAFLIQMVSNGRYGYFRDELYFLAASNHLALGYVDFAPLIAWLTRGFHIVFGDSLHAIRLLPALAFG